MLPESTRAVETKSVQCVGFMSERRSTHSKPRPLVDILSRPLSAPPRTPTSPLPGATGLSTARQTSRASCGRGAPRLVSLSGRLWARLLLHCPSRLPQDSSPSSSFLGLLTSGLPGGGMEGTPGAPLPPSRQPVLALWPRAAPSSYTPARCLEDVETPPPLSRREDSDKK